MAVALALAREQHQHVLLKECPSKSPHESDPLSASPCPLAPIFSMVQMGTSHPCKQQATQKGFEPKRCLGKCYKTKRRGGKGAAAPLDETRPRRREAAAPLEE